MKRQSLKLFGRSASRHDCTAYIQVDRRRCLACGACVSACAKEVLGIVSFFYHRHVHVDDAASCCGCLRCVHACPQNAILVLNANSEASTNAY
jgi:ferredoxin